MDTASTVDSAIRFLEFIIPRSRATRSTPNHKTFRKHPCIDPEVDGIGTTKSISNTSETSYNSL